jgi:hypothetical protein
MEEVDTNKEKIANAQRITRKILEEAKKRKEEAEKNNLQKKYEGEERRIGMLDRFIKVIQGF